MNGGLRLACNEERWTEVKRQATTAHSFGLEMQLLTPQEAFDLWPLMTIDDLVGAAFLPTDGQANPSDITRRWRRAPAWPGVSIFEDTEVIDLEIDNGRIRAVVTAQGRIECETCRRLRRAVDARFRRPLRRQRPARLGRAPVYHHRVLRACRSNLPTLRDPDRLTYYKEEVGGIVMGGYEPNPIPWAMDGIPEGFHYTLLDSNFEHFEQIMEQALGRVPALENVGVKQLLNGPESFTPDGNFILGEAPELKNFFVGAGFNAFGIASGGGAGMALAEWVANGEPPYDLWPVDIRRFGRPHFDTDWVRTRTLEAYGKHYTMACPSRSIQAAGPAATRRSTTG